MDSSYWRPPKFEDAKTAVNWQFIASFTRRADAQAASCQSDFQEKGYVGGRYEDHRTYEKQGDRSSETRAEEGVCKQCDDHQRNQHCRAAAHGDRAIEIPGALCEHTEVVVYLTRICR